MMIIIYDTIYIDWYLENFRSPKSSNLYDISQGFFHDRYIILDRVEVYVSGMSLKDVGKKYSYIYKMNEKMFIDELIKGVIKL